MSRNHDTERDIARGIERQKQASNTANLMGGLGCFVVMILCAIAIGLIGYVSGWMILAACIISIAAGLVIASAVQRRIMNR